ncbi:secretin N-terminal domain-containing protein [Rubinisphaera italica]|uniref:Putative type II secretion system protein D n=1 Tax=Rubinisphaera italica TaxID=2527969 RepID=A0A5C5XKJ5_9PLAN|nr:secretin N-terminal domain-containing protein [Rubinisphaera italica]TWT62951.1 putative type II secretion system protein D precursor [Rubinisphaera italica]
MRDLILKICLPAILCLVLQPARLIGEENTPEIHLRFVSKSWSSILKELAEDTGQQLVMPKAPRGRLSRYDRNPYTPADAIQILNQELESTGFRIMDKGKFLIVLEDDQFRQRYSPYVNETKDPNTVKKSGEVSHLQMTQTSKQIPAQRIEQAAFEEVTAASEKNSQEALAIEPKFLNATALARQVYDIYGDHAELIEEGPLGLPAFKVSVPSDGKTLPVTFTMGIDQQSNRIILVAEKAAREKLVGVMDVLDQAADKSRATPKDKSTEVMFAPQEVHEATSKQLPKILAQVQQAATQNEQAPTSPTQPTPENPAQPGPSADLNAILDQIRGDVSIEALNELGLLILRGNEADVESVMQIVRAIETMSAGTTPEIHLRYLTQVNSEGLATLLNSVYESVQSTDQRASRQNRPVNLIPVVQPNAVLIVAPSIEMEAVKQLIDELDQEVDPKLQLQLFRLKNAGAAEAVTVIEEFYEERPGLGTRVRITADTRTNSLIVQADPRDLKEISKLIHDLDKDESHAISRLQIIPLKNAVAEELAEFINTALDEALNPRQSTQQGNQQQNNQPKSFVLEFLAGSGTQAELVRSGILSDVRISADPRTNSLTVIAPERSLPLITALIQSLDQPSDAEAEVKVFTLIHADAAASLTLLQELFDENNAESPVGVNLAGTSDSGSTLLPLRFSVDVRSNSILAIGGRDALTVVEAILLRLDNAAPKKRINQVIEMRNVPAADAAEAINLFLESQRELNSIDPALVSSFELLEREVIIVPEPLSNNLLISATPEYFAEIMAVVEQIDCDPAQVVIQALLVEVELNNLDEFGVELGFQDSILFDRSVIDNLLTVTNTTTNQNIQTTSQQIVSQDGAPGFLFNNPSIYPNLGNNTGPASQPNLVAGQGLANFGVGRVNGDLGFGGLVLSASSESVSVLIRALAQQRNVQVLSRPQIRTVDSQLAQIQVGQEVPIINGVNITANGVANPNIIYDEAGIILSVTPRVKPDGQIVMEVVAERSAYQAGGVPIFVDAENGNTINSPIKNISVARATVGVGDGQTIVLGGMISKTEDTTIRKVPWLGDLPIIGRAFRFDSESNIRTELLIFLTPRIIHNDETNEMVKEVEAGRIHFFREEFEEIHGPIFGIPDPHAFESPMSPAEVDWEKHPELAPLPMEMESDDLESSREEATQETQDSIPRTMVAPGQLQPMSHQQVPQKTPSGIPWKRYPLYKKPDSQNTKGQVRLKN